ncbi:hypothetical protein [Rufibacter roseus]|uniref:Uncharacterized protein n=1 Tax=Rufibacter roseus TaxID=1567108 RepID=A0ABW2DN19_9BACT|nr:hypothetical protein [Rufibacter roseus]
MQKFPAFLYHHFGTRVGKFILVALVFVSIGAIFQAGVSVGEILFYVTR